MVWRSWLTFLVEEGIIAQSPFRVRRHLPAVDPARLWHPNRVGGIRRALDATAAQALVDHAFAAPAITGLALMLMLVGGLRRSEVLAVRGQDVVIENGTTRVVVHGKGDRLRRVDAEPILCAALERARVEHFGRPITSGFLVPRSRRTLARWVSAAGAAIGRPDITPHELRRSAATLFRDAGAPLDRVQAHLGHSRPDLTSRMYDARSQVRPLPALPLTLPKPKDPNDR